MLKLAVQSCFLLLITACGSDLLHDDGSLKNGLENKKKKTTPGMEIDSGGSTKENTIHSPGAPDGAPAPAGIPGVENARYAPATAGIPGAQNAAYAPAPETSLGLPYNFVSGWIESEKDNLSTFAADVDTGSYTHARANLNRAQQPDPKEIRVEEFINYFPYSYPEPVENDIFSVTLDSTSSPFNDTNAILRVGVQGKNPNKDKPRKRVNLVFLTDVSGSMAGPDRLDLAKSAMEVLVNSLHENDRIGIVTYASSTAVVLPLTPMSNRASIIDAIYSLNADGSTAMGDGIKLAYNEAEKGLSNDSVSRVIVLSDGDANVGSTSHEEILKTIEEKVQKGIYLTTMGFGLGNYKDEMMEQLANKGNGNHYYVDSLTEAKRVFQSQVDGTLDVIAKDLKIQVEFDKNQVAEYRLLGYENRSIADEDFRTDEVDAGELGPGHSVTALYEIKPQGELRNSLATVRLRYKNPEEEKSVLEHEYIYQDKNNYISKEQTPRDFKLALAAASFAELLRNSPYAGGVNLESIEQECSNFIDQDDVIEHELFGLIQKARGFSEK